MKSLIPRLPEQIPALAVRFIALLFCHSQRDAFGKMRQGTKVLIPPRAVPAS